MTAAIECMKHPGNTDPTCRTCWAADLVERAGRVEGLELRIATLERRLARVLHIAQQTGHRKRTAWPQVGTWSFGKVEANRMARVAAARAGSRRGER